MQRWLKERGEPYKLRDPWEICNGDYNGWQKHVKESKNRKAETHSKSPTYEQAPFREHVA